MVDFNMLTEKRIGILAYILEYKDTLWNINSISKYLNLSYPTCYDFVHELLKLGYIKKNNGSFSVVDIEAIINYISVSYPFISKEKKCFYDSGNNANRLELIKATGLEYAFTLFTAGEMLYPYVHTNKTYLYVNKLELNTWKEIFIKKYIRNSNEEEGNIFLLPVEENFYFNLSKKVNGSKIAPLAIIISDLVSSGSIGKDQGTMILNKLISGELNLNG